MSKIDHIEEIEPRFEHIEEVEKFNPYHDSRGRFSSSNGYASFTYKPGQGKMYDLAIQREKDRQAAAEGKPAAAAKPAQVDTSKPPAGTKTQTDHPPGQHENWQFVQKITGTSDPLEAKEMFDATKKFTGAFYDDIREAGYKGSPPASKQAKTWSDRVDKMIEEAPKYDGQVYRGIGTKPETAEQIVAQAKAGHLISQMGAASFSTSPGVADSFARRNEKGAMVVFETKGVQNGTSVKAISQYTTENEVLMSSKATWKPTGKIKEEEVNTWGEKVKKYTIEMEPFWGDPAEYESGISQT